MLSIGNYLLYFIGFVFLVSFVVLLIMGIRKFYKVYKQDPDKIYLILTVIYAILLFPVGYFLFVLLSRFINSFL